MPHASSHVYGPAITKGSARYLAVPLACDYHATNAARNHYPVVTSVQEYVGRYVLALITAKSAERREMNLWTSLEGQIMHRSM